MVYSHTSIMYMYTCAVLLTLFVSLTLLASFFLPSHLSLKTCTCTCMCKDCARIVYYQ